MKEGRSVGAAPAKSPTSGRQPWTTLLREVAADRTSRLVFVTVLIGVGFGDSILLPYDYTQRISFTNWQYFGPRYLAFTIGFALAMAWVLTLQIHSMRMVIARTRDRAAGRTGPFGALAAVVSLLPSFLCCSPIVPTLVSLLSLSATTQLRTSASIQYFFATKQNYLLLGSLALVIASGIWSMRKLARSACLDEDGCLAEGDCCDAAGSAAGAERARSFGLGFASSRPSGGRAVDGSS